MMATNAIIAATLTKVMLKSSEPMNHYNISRLMRRRVAVGAHKFFGIHVSTGTDFSITLFASRLAKIFFYSSNVSVSTAIISRRGRRKVGE